MPMTTCETVANLNYPSYAIVSMTGRHIVVGGGGGAAKTGIMNQFDVFELYHDGKQTVGERVLSHDVGDYCITNMAGWAENPKSGKDESPSFMLSVGLEEKCDLIKLTQTIKSMETEEDSTEVQAKNEKGQHKAIRKRRGSERNAEEGTTIAREETEKERKRRKSVNTTLRGEKYFSFIVEKISSTETVSKKQAEEEPYQKCCRVSADHKLLVTGGTDGHVRVWGLPGMTKVKDVKAHEKEVDDLDIKPDGKQIVSVSKPSRECFVWNVKDGKKLIQVALQTNGVKYKCFRARYGTVEANPAKTRLFTISNPVTGTKNPSIVAKWCGKSYTQEKTQNLTGSLSSLALSDDGRFLATGTMGGTVYILVAFSLQKLQTIEEAHSMFVTGLEWLPTNDAESQMIRGYTDASVLSISCDNSLKIHHIPKPGMVPVWIVAVLAAIVLFCAFLFASFLGL